MLLDIREKSVCILVEKSIQTQPFLPAIKELIISLLVEKRNSQDPFLFNIAYFDREPCFWTDQVTKCTTEAAYDAAHWIRAWSNSSGHSSIGPHTASAIVAAYNDPFVACVYVLTASLPYETASDLINYVKYSRKDRPLHVIFLASRFHVDEKAMHLLHLVTKQCEGSFRAAYYHSNGVHCDLIEIPPPKRHISIATSPETVLHISPGATSLPEIPSLQISPPTPFISRLAQLPQSDSYTDLVIKIPHQETPMKHASFQLPESTCLHSSCGYPQCLQSTGRSGEQQRFHLESTESGPLENNHFSSTSSPEMEDIKRRFAEFYFRKKNNEFYGQNSWLLQNSSNISSLPDENFDLADAPEQRAKVLQFKGAQRDPTPFPSPTLSLESKYGGNEYGKNDISMRTRGSVDISPEIEQLPTQPYSHNISPVTETARSPDSDTRQSPSSRLAVTPNARVPVTIYSKMHPTSPNLTLRSPKPPISVGSSRSKTSFAKPPWRTGRTSASFKPCGTVGMEDRSRAWMNRWMNEWVERHEPRNGQGRMHAAIQVNVEDTPIPALHRSKSEPRSLQITTYTQTPHKETEISEDIQTIRELLTKNTTLLNDLRDHSPVSKKMSTGRPFKRVVEPQNPKKGMPDKHVVERDEQGNSPATNRFKARSEQVQEAVSRQERIQKQQEQKCYKAMYEKLVGNLTRRSETMAAPDISEAPVNTATNSGLIARLPEKNVQR